MKQRLVVMNGQKLVQNEGVGEWITAKVEKAGLIRPGLYNLYLASEADHGKVHEGLILYADTNHVFQQAGKILVKHAINAFETVPETGKLMQIRYAEAKAQVIVAVQKRGRGVAR